MKLLMSCYLNGSIFKQNVITVRFTSGLSKRKRAVGGRHTATKDGLTRDDCKKKITEHKRDVSTTLGEQSTTSVSFIDDRIAAIIGETPQKAITPDLRV